MSTNVDRILDLESQRRNLLRCVELTSETIDAIFDRLSVEEFEEYRSRVAATAPSKGAGNEWLRQINQQRDEWIVTATRLLERAEQAESENARLRAALKYDLAEKLGCAEESLPYRDFIAHMSYLEACAQERTRPWKWYHLDAAVQEYHRQRADFNVADFQAQNAPHEPRTPAPGGSD